MPAATSAADNARPSGVAAAADDLEAPRPDALAVGWASSYDLPRVPWGSPPAVGGVWTSSRSFSWGSVTSDEDIGRSYGPDVRALARRTCARPRRARSRWCPLTQKGPPHDVRRAFPLLPNQVRRCPTLPQGPPCSTIGAESLSFRVRNVTGRFPLAMAAVTLSDTPTSRRLGGGQIWVTRHACVLLSAPTCRARCADRVFANTTRGMEPVFWEPQSGRKQSLTTPTSLYNGMSVVIIKLSAY